MKNSSHGISTFISAIREKKEGIFLIETMVALTLITVGLLGLVVLLTRSLILNKSVQNRFIAAALAAEGIETVKNLIDANIAQGSDWDKGISNGDYCVDPGGVPILALAGQGGCSTLLFDPVSGIYSRSGRGSPSNFIRKITVTNNGQNIVVKSNVSWSVRGTTSAIDVEDRFYNWRR